MFKIRGIDEVSLDHGQTVNMSDTSLSKDNLIKLLTQKKLLLDNYNTDS